MFLQPPIILVVPGSTVPNLVHIDSGEDDDYDNENYGDHTAICRRRLVAMSNLRSPTSYVHIAPGIAHDHLCEPNDRLHGTLYTPDQQAGRNPTIHSGTTLGRKVLETAERYRFYRI